MWAAGIEFERACEGERRLPVLARFGQRRAKVMVKQGILVGKFDSAPVRGHRALEMFELGQRISKVGPDARRPWAALERVAITPQRVEVATHRRKHDAARVAQVTVLGVARDCSTQQGLRFGEFAGVVQRGGETPRPK
jgi:hypothetical protein